VLSASKVEQLRRNAKIVFVLRQDVAFAEADNQFSPAFTTAQDDLSWNS
jgi:hypothetical protein